jgi:hypothetical protein
MMLAPGATVIDAPDGTMKLSVKVLAPTFLSTVLVCAKAEQTMRAARQSSFR